MKLALKFASGPLVFLILYSLPSEELSPAGLRALAVFGWMVMWWIARPVPWGISSLLPLLLFPALGLMSITQTVSRYGQNIFFWIMGTILMGYAIHRHGLAQRFALWFLSLPGVGKSTNRLCFGFMLVTGVISMHISDAATVAMMIPVGVSLSSFVRSLTGSGSAHRSNFGAFLALGAMYASAVGGIATIAGVPYNALSIALLEKFTGRTLGWFNWMLAGVPIFLAGLFTLYYLLRLFLPPEIPAIPGGEAFIRKEREKLGPFSPGERATFFVFVVMISLFTLPPLLGLALGPAHPVNRWMGTALPIWTVPIVVLFLLFCTPVNWSRGEFILSWREAVEHSPWDIMLMCAAAVAVTDTLMEFGFVELIGTWMKQMGIGPRAIPFVGAYLMAFSTNLFSGTAATSFFGSIFIPAAHQVGFNPASMAMIIPNVAVGLMVPWSGAVAGTAFASGEIEMKNMIRIGAVATLIFPLLVASLHILLSPFL